mmetsp:Transcript_114144/g.327935  ORF Transcript_114144/g.327935 Transcript_114144/m.327935 type:complete len:219 (+) Transcript_114144:854-1510(+)
MEIQEANRLEEGKQETHTNERHRFAVGVEYVVRLVPFTVRQSSTDRVTEHLYEAERHSQADDIVFGLFGLFVPLLLEDVPLPVVREGDEVPRMVRDPAEEKDDHPCEHRDQGQGHALPGHLLLHRRKCIDGGEARDVAEEHGETLQPCLQLVEDLRSGFRLVLRHRARHPRQGSLKQNEPHDHLDDAHSELDGLRSSFQDVGLDQAVASLEDEDGGEN